MIAAATDTASSDDQRGSVRIKEARTNLIIASSAWFSQTLGKTPAVKVSGCLSLDCAINEAVVLIVSERCRRQCLAAKEILFQDRVEGRQSPVRWRRHFPLISHSNTL